MLLAQVEKIVVIGAGGTGSLLIPLIVRHLSNPNRVFNGTFIVADGDSYSESNLSRQDFNPVYVGKNKAEYQIMAAQSKVPISKNWAVAIPHYLSKEHINDLVTENTIVINCADNKAIRKFVEDRVRRLSNAAHICCGNELNHGQCQISVVENGRSLTPTIYDRSPNFNSIDDSRSEMDCEQINALPSGGQTLAANNMAAAIAFNMFVQLADGHKFNQQLGIPFDMVSFDVIRGNIVCHK